MKLFTCIHIDDDPILIKQFVKYYRDCAIDDFRIILHANQQYSKGLAPQLEKFEQLLDSVGLKVGRYWLEELFTDDEKQYRLNDYKREVCDPAKGEGCYEEWTIQVDVDEFIDKEIFNDQEFFELDDDQFTKGDFVMGKLSDRVSKDGTFPFIKEDTNLFTKFPVQAAITKYVNKADDNKVPISRGWVMLGAGHHWPMPQELQWWHIKRIKENTVFQQRTGKRLRVHHFKYIGGILENIKAKLEKNVNISEVGWKGEMMKFIIFLLLECKGPKIDINKLVLFEDEYKDEG